MDPEDHDGSGFSSAGRPGGRLDSSSSRPPGLLLPAEVAAELRCSQGSVYRWIQAGQLPAVRLGSGPKARLRIRREDLDEFSRPSWRL